jgi:sorbitol-specific phosphotransferase system component IIBC
MRILRVLAVIAALIAIILFAVGALSNGTSAGATPVHDLMWGLVALAAAVGLLALDPMVP